MRLTRGNPLLAGVLTLAVIGAVVLLAVGIDTSFGLPGDVSLGLPPTRDYTLRATFTDANGLIKGAGVQVAGTPIGQVTGVTGSGRQAIVAMRIDHRYAPLHTGTIAAIRYSTLLAQKYVELSPAAGTKPLGDGATIPSTETVTPVDFDQFLSTLDPETRRQAQVLVQQLGGGVEGRGETLNLLLDQLSGLAGESQGGLGTLNAHTGDLSSITANLAVTSQRLAISRQQLGDLVANTASVAGTLSQNDRSLDDLLVRLAHTSADVDQTLNGNEGNLHDTITTLDPFLNGLNGNLATTYPYDAHDEAQMSLRQSVGEVTERLRHEIMPRVWEKVPQARLRVVSGPDPARYWREFMKRAYPAVDPRIELHAFVEDLRPLYARAAVVVTPLVVSAGTNIKVLEAMAMGRAIVSTPAGVNGLDLSPGSDFLLVRTAEEMAVAIEKLLVDPCERRRIAAAARQRVERQFGWDTIARRQARLYRDLSG